MRQTQYAIRFGGIVASFLLGFLSLHATAGTSMAQDVPDLAAGRVLTLVKGDQPAQVREPYRALVTDDGRLFLTDTKKKDVLWFDQNLVWKGNLAAMRPVGFGRPVRTVLDSHGRILVADADTREISVFSDGALVGVRGGQGRGPGRFGSLDDIAIDADDMLWAADSDRRRLQVFTADGLLERVVAGFGNVSFDRPRLVALGRGGRVVVFDAGLKQILSGSVDGSLTWALDLETALVDGKDLYDLAIDPSGVVYLLLKDDSRVAVVSSDGLVVDELFGKSGIPRPFDRLTGLSINAERGVVVAVDQKDLVVQEMLVDYGSELAIEPFRRSHIGVAVDSLDGQPLAVSPGASLDDPSDDRILVRDASGVSIVSDDGRTVARLSIATALPRDVTALGTADSFIVVDANNTARVFSMDGILTGTIPLTTAGGQLKRPTAMAWRASDGVYAIYDRDDDEIQLLAADFSFLQRVGRKGQADGEISDAVGVAFDYEGKLLVLDLDGTRAQVFDRHGIFVSKSSPPVLGVVGVSPSAGIGADAWGRWFTLDETSGVVSQVSNGNVDCQVGAPGQIQEPRRLIATPNGDFFVGGGEVAYSAVRFRCAGPPPAPLRAAFSLPGDGGPTLTWSASVPGATSYEIRRGSGEDAVILGRSSGSDYTVNREAWGREPAELSVRGVTAGGQGGPWSESAVDRISPALRALLDGGDPASAERWLSEELSAARDERRDDVPRLRAAYLESILAQKDYDRAASELRRFEAGMDPEDAARVSMEIARSAVTGSIEAGEGDIALRWVGYIRDEDPSALSNIERRALQLEAASDYDGATMLLVEYGRGRDLDDVELTRAVAQVMLMLARPYGALELLMDSGREARSTTTRSELDQEIFDVTAATMDGVLDGTIPPAPGLSPEEETRAMLDRLRDYLRQTGRGGAAEGGTDAGQALAGGGDQTDEMWRLRLGALEAKPRALAAVDLEATDFEAARAEYVAILAENEFLLADDEVSIRSHLGALELASGNEDSARDQFERILSIDPLWVPDPDEFSPSVREFVASLANPSEATDEQTGDGSQ